MAEPITESDIANLVAQHAPTNGTYVHVACWRFAYVAMCANREQPG